MISYKDYEQKVLKKNDRIHAKYLNRPITTRISWLILKMYPEVTPNQVTLLNFGIGLIGVSILFLAKNSVEIMFGALILYLWTILDGVDGEIARFRDMKTPSGFFLEITFDYFIIALIPLGVSFYLYSSFSQTNAPLLLGFIDCLAILSYAFINANYNWTFLRFNTGLQDIDSNDTESQIMKELGGKSPFVNKLTAQIGKVMLRMGNFLIYSGHIVLILILLSIANVICLEKVLLLNQLTVWHLFLLPWSMLFLVSISLIIFNYILLKTSLESKAPPNH